jgi:hypothetical protein
MMALPVVSHLAKTAKVAAGSVLVLAAGLAGYANSTDVSFVNATSGIPGFETGTVAGPAQSLGDGTAHVFVTKKNGQPTALGVRVTESALATLPAHGNAHGSHETVLALPTNAPVAPFDHVSFDWQPQGHEPDGVYTLPHFDVHFYMMTMAERHTIVPTDPAFDAKASRPLDTQYLPAGYVPAPGAIPMMGAHWVDPTSPEFTPAGFSRTFIYGVWDGRMTFVEPMLTKTFIESVKAMPGQSVTFAVPQPQAFEKAGYYPTAYSVRYDAQAQAYDLVLENLTLRTAPTS